MIFSLVAMTGLEKCCITSAYLQWLCHSGERPVARGPLVISYVWVTYSYVEVIISYVGVTISYVGLIISYVGLIISYVGLKYFFHLAPGRFHIKYPYPLKCQAKLFSRRHSEKIFFLENEPWNFSESSAWHIFKSVVCCSCDWRFKD